MVKTYRTESDSLGKKKVPSSAYYGIQTQRAIENFPISGVMHSPEFLDSYIIIKKAAAKTNTKLKLLDKKLAEAAQSNPYFGTSSALNKTLITYYEYKILRIQEYRGGE